MEQCCSGSGRTVPGRPPPAHLNRIHSIHSSSHHVRCTQWSVLGPIVSLLYTADLLSLIEGHCLCPHLYAVDIQIYGFFFHRPRRCSFKTSFPLASTTSLRGCDQTDCSGIQRRPRSSGSQQAVVSISYPRLRFESALTMSCHASVVRDIGIYLDSDLSLRSRVGETVCSCFAIVLYCVSYRVSAGQFPDPFSSCW